MSSDSKSRPEEKPWLEEGPRPGEEPRPEVAVSGGHKPDVVLLGEWPAADADAGKPVPGAVAVVPESSRDGRGPRSWPRRVGRHLRSWRPSAVLALLLLTAAVFMLLDLRGGPTQTLRSLGQSVGGPAQEWGDRIIGPIRDTPLRRADELALRGSIAELAARNEMLKQKNSTLKSRLRDVSEAGEITKWAKSAQLEMTPARVVAVESGRTPNQSLTLDVGRHDGLEPNLAVVGQGALVGRLVEVGPDTSTVQLISDPASRVWAQIAESRESVVATGSGTGIELDFVDLQAQIEPDQTVATMGSPGSRPYPAGIRIARVVSVSGQPDQSGQLGQAGQRVTAEPIADLSALDVVAVISPRTGGDAE